MSRHFGVVPDEIFLAAMLQKQPHSLLYVQRIAQNRHHCIADITTQSTHTQLNCGISNINITNTRDMMDIYVELELKGPNYIFFMYNLNISNPPISKSFSLPHQVRDNEI